LFLGTIDLELHLDHAPAGSVDVAAVNKAVKQRFLQVPIHQDDCYMASFLHIFSHDYSVGYYSYKWAEAIEADLFSRFAADGILNPATGRDYAEKVLSRGNEDHPAQLVRGFLGRDSSLDAMLHRDGLAHN
jgi:oligopeptidase A